VRVQLTAIGSGLAFGRIESYEVRFRSRRASSPSRNRPPVSLGGIYGIGGGSILGPILVGRGHPVAVVAPPPLSLPSFAASIVGALTYAALALVKHRDIAPNWSLGILCGLGGLIGGYLGARLQLFLPETALRLMLGLTAIAVGACYVVQAIA